MSIRDGGLITKADALRMKYARDPVYREATKQRARAWHFANLERSREAKRAYKKRKQQERKARKDQE